MPAERKADSYAAYDTLLAARPLPDCPWTGPPNSRVYVPLTALLADLLAIPIASGHAANTGRFPKAIDAWCAHELRRAGFEDVWPRATAPRVLPHDVAQLLSLLKKPDRKTVSDRLLQHGAGKVAPVEASILGGVYEKQTDVLIARWDRGAELVISTKSQLSSFGNNLKNRFEEAYGDAYNIKQRYPLACVGFLFFIRSTAPPKAMVFAEDMVRRLRGERLYDHTALVVGEWQNRPAFNGVTFKAVPADLSVDQFLGGMANCVLSRSPVSLHVKARECFNL